MKGNRNYKILFVLDGLFLGGVARNTLNLAEELAEQGHFVEILTFSPRGQLNTEVPDKVKTQSLDWPRSLCILPLANFFRRNDYDLVVSAKEFVNVSVIIGRALAKNTSPLVISTRTQLSIEAQKIKNFQLRIIHWLSRKLYHKADHIVAVSAGVADDMADYLSLDRSKISVIYNPCVRESMLTLQARAPHPWFTQDAEPVIVGCGRLVEQKNFELLIRAFSKVREQLPCRLLILGEGPQRPLLKKLIEDFGIGDSCELVGFVLNPLDYVSWARLYVSSSDYEGFGNTIAEALAVGTPVVATDCPSGPGEILGFGKYGQLIERNDYEALVAAMLAALNEPLRNESELKNRAKDFTPIVAARKYLELIG